MSQLDLFDHAYRHYHEALRALGRLDLEVFETNLERHRASGGNPREIERAEEAAAWLRQHVPPPDLAVEAWGRASVALCRALREGLAEGGVLARRGEVTASIVGQAARDALRRMAEEGIPGSRPLAAGLPWGVFRLLAGSPEGAMEDLAVFLRTRGPSAPAAHALGEALASLGREEEAFRAWREAYGASPFDPGWGPEPLPIASLRAAFRDDPLFAEAWWAVGAYVDGRFPRYALAGPAEASSRWRRFLAGDEAFRRGELSAPVLFFLGLHPSEHGHLLPPRDAGRVRRVLRSLHPEACELHLEQLERQGPPNLPLGRWAVLG